MKSATERSLLPLSIILLFFSIKVFSQDDSTEAKINDLITKMTLEEKVTMIHANSAFTSSGVERLGIRELMMSDGPHGVRPEQGRYWSNPPKIPDSGTYLPVGVCLTSFGGATHRRP